MHVHYLVGGDRPTSVTAAQNARDRAGNLAAQAALAARQHAVMVRCLEQRERLVEGALQLMGDCADDALWQTCVQQSAIQLCKHIALQRRHDE